MEEFLPIYRICFENGSHIRYSELSLPYKRNLKIFKDHPLFEQATGQFIDHLLDNSKIECNYPTDFLNGYVYVYNLDKELSNRENKKSKWMPSIISSWVYGANKSSTYLDIAKKIQNPYIKDSFSVVLHSKDCDSHLVSTVKPCCDLILPTEGLEDKKLQESDMHNLVMFMTRLGINSVPFKGSLHI